jgi:hypothetical protein
MVWKSNQNVFFFHKGHCFIVNIMKINCSIVYIEYRADVKMFVIILNLS